MEELQKIMAGPVEKTIGGETVTFAQLTFGMLAEFEKWAHDEYDKRRKAEIRERLDDLASIPDLSPFDRGKLTLEVHNSTRPFDLVEAMYAMTGAVQLLTISAQVHDSKMTPARMGKLLPFQIDVVHGLINDLTPVGPVTPEEQRAQQIRTARGRLESAAAEKDNAAGNKECRAKIADAVKLLYEALNETKPGATVPPVEPATV